MTEWLDLTGCQGYCVDRGGGRIGSVAAVLPRTEGAEPSVLIMHSGLVGCGLMVVPFEQIEAVDHEHRRLLLGEESVTLQQGAPPGARGRTLTRA